MESVAVISFNNKTDHPLGQNWTNTLDKTGLEYFIVGNNISQANLKKDWSIRTREYLKFIQNTNYDYYVVTDCWDVLPNTLLPNMDNKIISAIKRHGNKIIIGAESFCHPRDKTCYNTHPLIIHMSKNGNNIYPNGGLLMGPRDLLIHYYNFAINFKDDQVASRNYMKEYPQNIYLDTQSQYFCNHIKGPPTFLHPNSANKTCLNNDVLFYHFPGNNDPDAYNKMCESFNEKCNAMNYSLLSYILMLLKKYLWIILVILLIFCIVKMN